MTANIRHHMPAYATIRNYTGGSGGWTPTIVVSRIIVFATILSLSSIATQHATDEDRPSFPILWSSKKNFSLDRHTKIGVAAHTVMVVMVLRVIFQYLDQAKVMVAMIVDSMAAAVDFPRGIGNITATRWSWLMMVLVFPPPYLHQVTRATSPPPTHTGV